MLGGYTESMEIEDSPQKWPTELAKQGSNRFTHTVEACNAHAGVRSSNSGNKLLLISCFCGTPNCGIRCVLFWFECS